MSKSSSNEKQKSFASDLNKLRVLTKVEQEVNNSLTLLNKEMHEQRLKEMREIGDKLKEDAWKYPSVEKLLGLQ